MKWKNTNSIPAHLLNSKLITDEEWEEYQDLKGRVRMYEDPDDFTLFYMWLDEKAKDKMTDLRIKLSAREEVARVYEIELKEANDSIVWWQNRYKALERENEHLRTELNTSKSKREKVTSKYKTLKKLQEENNRLKERNHINIERNAQAYKIVDDYEFRIKKAIVYCKENAILRTEKEDRWVNKLLDILEGDNNE